MKIRVLLPTAGLMMLMILFVGGALCGSCNTNDDWSLSQADRHAAGSALSAQFRAARSSGR
jgi:hypothetical protein